MRQRRLQKEGGRGEDGRGKERMERRREGGGETGFLQRAA